jgi:hypothetical protein
MKIDAVCRASVLPVSAALATGQITMRRLVLRADDIHAGGRT